MLASYAFTDRLWLFTEADPAPFSLPVKWTASLVRRLAEHRAVAVIHARNMLVMVPPVKLVTTKLKISEAKVRRAARQNRLGFSMYCSAPNAWTVRFSYWRSVAEVPAVLVRPEDAAKLDQLERKIEVT